MNQTGKIIVAVIVTAVVVGGGMYLFQHQEIVKQNKTDQNVAAINPIPLADGSTLHTDEKSGMTFSVPAGWTVGPDESGDTYTYAENPYRVVTFKVFADKASWQTVVNSFSGLTKSTDNDKWIKKENVNVGGLPAVLMVFERGTGSGTSFQYGEYFIDNGTKWFQISIDDTTSTEIQKIIQSIKF